MSKTFVQSGPYSKNYNHLGPSYKSIHANESYSKTNQLMLSIDESSED